MFLTSVDWLGVRTWPIWSQSKSILKNLGPGTEQEWVLRLRDGTRQALLVEVAVVTEGGRPPKGRILVALIPGSRLWVQRDSNIIIPASPLGLSY